LDHYVAFVNYVKARFPMGFESELVVVFDLGSRAGRS
jgi:hypothetical protein